MARPAAGFVRVWEFTVPTRRHAAFVRAYGPRGLWASLFAKSRGYLGTELIRSGKSRYLTIDRWRTAAAFRSFMRTHRRAYLALDAACARLTRSERPIGSGLTAGRRRT